ncbi:class I SAM-dependent methyltransferase [Micromonospora sp. STR1_7]|uniref:Class I SAM-dependent methyltransferase n=1 Tax=Micromonospora parastrephiae TaxID=2806101 RepID=A0ABS1XTK8_9ACTN|nr:class I SAM-dependent methyltransferase [Micromonospora parastrephiae]MBM0232580.1 class I SAM-dependent methyltransferase [Micromonospora parastrephiae]
MTAETYDRLSGRMLAGLYDRVARDVCAVASGPVLDVGTGPARLLRTVASRRPDLHLTGVDVSPQMVAVARQRVTEAGLTDRVTVDVADATALPYPDGSFAVVVSTLSLHHWPVPVAAVSELLRVLRPGGRLLIYDFRSAQMEQAARLVRADASASARVTLSSVPLSRWLPVPLFARLNVDTNPDGAPSNH